MQWDEKYNTSFSRLYDFQFLEKTADCVRKGSQLEKLNRKRTVRSTPNNNIVPHIAGY